MGKIASMSVVKKLNLYAKSVGILGKHLQLSEITHLTSPEYATRTVDNRIQTTNAFAKLVKHALTYVEENEMGIFLFKQATS
jgi:hypothetical protein